MSLKGKTALVTGAGRNIGREIALTFAREGANVAVLVRSNEMEANQVAAECSELGVRAIGLLADLSQVDQVDRAMDTALQEFGTIDILVNNAAVRPHNPFLEMSVDDWHWVLGVGLNGAFYCTRRVAPGMVEQGWGRIINISGQDGFQGRLNRAHGVTVKAGLHGFSKALATELGPHGITANTVVPGVINTTRPAAWYPDWSYDAMAARLPVRRVGQPNEIAAACTFLASESQGFVTGQAIHVNGGGLMP